MNTSEAEKIILGSVLLDPSTLTEAAQMISPEDFSLESNRHLWKIYLKLMDESKPIEPATIMDALGGSMEAIGGAIYFSTLTEGTVRRKSLEAYCRILQAQAKRRRFVNSCVAAIQACDDPSVAVDEAMAEHEQNLVSIRALGESGLVHVKEILPHVLNDIQRARDFNGEVYGTSTGVKAVDSATGGIREKELWVIGAKTSRGKTALACQIALLAAQRGEPVAIFALEMSQVATFKRFLVQRGLCDAGKMKDPKWMTQGQREDLYDVGAEIAGLPIWIDETPSQHVRRIIAKIRSAKHSHGIRMVVVDYLQLVRSTGQDERLRVTAAIQALRDMAKAESLKLIVLSQLKRTPNENDWPTLDCLQETGAIEQASDVVLFIHRLKHEGAFTGEDSLIIAKQRNGPVGAEPAVYLPDRFLFADRTR